MSDKHTAETAVTDWLLTIACLVGGIGWPVGSAARCTRPLS